MLWEQSFDDVDDALGIIIRLSLRYSKRVVNLTQRITDQSRLSLTSHVIKIFERMIRSTMVSYLEDNFLLSNKQHGFRKGRAVTQSLHSYSVIMTPS